MHESGETTESDYEFRRQGGLMPDEEEEGENDDDHQRSVRALVRLRWLHVHAGGGARDAAITAVTTSALASTC